MELLLRCCLKVDDRYLMTISDSFLQSLQQLFLHSIHHFYSCLFSAADLNINNWRFFLNLSLGVFHGAFCLDFTNSLDYVHLLQKTKHFSMYFEGIYISERVLLTHTCMYVYKTLNAKIDERHKSRGVLFYLALLLSPREMTWALATKCLMTTLQFS